MDSAVKNSEIFANILRDLRNVAERKETKYREEDIEKFKNCISNEVRNPIILSAVVGAVSGLLFPFKHTKIPTYMKRSFLGLFNFYLCSNIVLSYGAHSCLSKLGDNIKLKTETSAIKEQDTEDELAKLFSGDELPKFSDVSLPFLTDINSSSSDFNSLESKDDIRDLSMEEETNKKKYISYEELRKLNREKNEGRGSDDERKPQMKELSKQEFESHGKRTNIYGDVLE